MINRRKTKEVSIGNVKIGANNPIAVQSMCNTKTTDVGKTLKQIDSLTAAGCEIVRLAVENSEDIIAFSKIKRKVLVPLVADIQFDSKLALGAIDAGADKIRINPGNTTDFWSVLKYAREKDVAVRVGFNSGSSQGFDFSLLGKIDYHKTVFAAKDSDVNKTVAAYRKLSKLTDFPLHLGVTEAGTIISGSIKSAIGLGVLLSEGIGDTIRVSLAGDPVKEVAVAYKILQSLKLRENRVEVIACPTCSRCQIDVESIAEKVEEKTADIRNPLKVAVMGCPVNGPGEAKSADFGISGAKGMGVIFVKGKIIKQVKEDQIIDELMYILRTK